MLCSGFKADLTLQQVVADREVLVEVPALDPIVVCDLIVANEIEVAEACFVRIVVTLWIHRQVGRILSISQYELNIWEFLKWKFN